MTVEAVEEAAAGEIDNFLLRLIKRFLFLKR